MLEVKGLSFSYARNKIFENVDFCLDKGECLVVFGANGIGKSTLLSTLAGLNRPRSGSIVRPSGVPGYIPQDGGIFEDMSVGDNLRFFAGALGAKKALSSPLPFGFSANDRRRVSKLSGGNKKKLSIVCALLGAPGLLLLDEPCAGLDLNYRDELQGLIAEEKAKGTEIVYVGHEPGEFFPFFDKLLIMRREGVRLYTRSEVIKNDSDGLNELTAFLRPLCE